MRRAWIVAAAASGVMCSPAGQAAAQEQNPWLVIGQLELAGYTVNVDRIGNAPLGECVVTEVRNPQQVVRPVRVFDGRDDLDVIDVVVRQSISVTLDCTG